MWSHHARSQTTGLRKKTTENYNPFISNFFKLRYIILTEYILHQVLL